MSSAIRAKVSKFLVMGVIRFNNTFFNLNDLLLDLGLDANLLVVRAVKHKAASYDDNYG